ncbi:MAG: helix-turn-helix transcriptional regulator, partial [Pseudomonadota bacterium]
MATTERRDLTEQERRRASIFKRAWLAKKKREKLTQVDAGDALSMTPSAFGQYMNGKVPIGLAAGLSLCAYLEVAVEDVRLPLPE